MSWFAIIPVIGSLIDKLIPDKMQAEQAKRELEKLEQTGELQILINQIKANTQEAKHSSLFIAGWRPFIGWTCGVAFAYHYVLLPLLLFIAGLHGTVLVLPAFDMGSLLTVLLGMLGLGGLRSFEKFKGIARQSMKD